eukprot:918292-Amphidinium_carterae.2
MRINTNNHTPTSAVVPCSNTERQPPPFHRDTTSNTLGGTVQQYAPQWTTALTIVTPSSTPIVLVCYQR